MKKFLTYLVFILGVTLILMIFLDQGYTYVYKNGLSRNRFQSRIKLKNKHYNIGFYGSSRVENHIDAKMIEKATGRSSINLGFSGATLADILVLAELNNSNNVTFDTVFVQIDYNYNSEELSPLFKANLVPYMDEEIVDKTLAGEDDYELYKYVPFYKYLRNEKVVGLRELLSVLSKKKTNVITSIGFKPQYGIGTDVHGGFPKQMQSNNSRLKAIKNLFQDKTLYFFTAPYCKEMVNRENIDDLKGKVNSYKNFSAIFDSHPEYFFDCWHLNIEGAEEFTKRIITEYNL